jgi:hypothetical protein
VGLADKEAVPFFLSGEGRLARLVHCPASIRERLMSQAKLG